MIQEDYQLIHAHDADGYTALHRAVYEGKKDAAEVCQYLQSCYVILISNYVSLAYVFLSFCWPKVPM